MEYAIYEQIDQYLDSNKVITPCQRGVRKNYSIETASPDLILDIYESLDHKKITLGIFFDLISVFDTINQKLIELN